MCAENVIRIDLVTNRLTSAPMVALLFFFLTLLAAVKSSSRVPIVNHIRWRRRRIGRCSHPMWDGCRLIWSLLIGLFRSRATLEAENMVLRQQIIVLRRTAPKRLGFNVVDRMTLVGLYRLFPDVRSFAGGRQARDCRSVASGGFQSLVPTVNLIRWRGTPNRAMFPPDVGRLQIDLVAADRLIPIESDA